MEEFNAEKFKKYVFITEGAFLHADNHRQPRILSCYKLYLR
jgi:hypothetical protein